MQQRIYYHRPQTTRFHTKKCVLLEDGDIERYQKVTIEDIKEDGLLPCPICLSGAVSQAKVTHE